MKILFTAPRFHTNQSPIVKGLADKGHEVRYFVVFVGVTEDHSVCAPIVLKPSKTTLREKRKFSKTHNESEIESLIGGRFIPDFKFLRAIFEEYMPDVVICREKTNLTLCVKALCDEYNIPCVLYDQEPIHKLKNAVKRAVVFKPKLRDRVFNKLDKTFNPDRKMLDRFRQSSGFPTVHMTPVFYSRLPFSLSEEKTGEEDYFIPFIAKIGERKERYLKGDCLNILTVGKFREYKNLKIIVNAAKILKNDFNWRITVVGQINNSDEREYYDEFVQLINDNNLAEKFLIKSNVPYKEMEQIYLENDLFVLTSKREVASISVIEAMSHGLAVISTDYNGTASYVLKANAGYVFETENEKDLADKIALATSKVEYFGKNAAEYVENNLQFEEYYNALVLMLKKRFSKYEKISYLN